MMIMIHQFKDLIFNLIISLSLWLMIYMPSRTVSSNLPYRRDVFAIPSIEGKFLLWSSHLYNCFWSPQVVVADHQPHSARVLRLRALTLVVSFYEIEFLCRNMYKTLSYRRFFWNWINSQYLIIVQQLCLKYIHTNIILCR